MPNGPNWPSLSGGCPVWPTRKLRGGGCFEAIESTGVDAGDVSKMGMVMGALMKEHKAELDGKLAQKIVREELS